MTLDSLSRTTLRASLRQATAGMRRAIRRNRAALAGLGALSYPALVLFVPSSSPFAPDPSWGLAAEHGSLGVEHRYHLVMPVFMALPAAIAFKPRGNRLPLPPLPVFWLLAALPYAAQPTHSFAANDRWLANYAWQLAADEVVLAPLLVASMSKAIALPRGCAR